MFFVLVFETKAGAELTMQPQPTLKLKIFLALNKRINNQATILKPL